jgi:hypothetical protein
MKLQMHAVVVEVNDEELAMECVGRVGVPPVILSA